MTTQTSGARGSQGTTGRGIALEDLTGIRARVRHRKPQRVMMNSWSFAQLGSFIAYKAQRAGVPVVYVDPRYTSKECADCHHIAKLNRASQALFICRAAASLRTQTGMLPATSLLAQLLRGTRGGSHPPRPRETAVKTWQVIRQPAGA